MQLVHGSKEGHDNPVDPTDSHPPPRKRRRPALSCEQCRKRKIKCDREYPCGQCQQSKTAICSYSPDSIANSNHVSSTTSPPEVSRSRHNDFSAHPDPVWRIAPGHSRSHETGPHHAEIDASIGAIFAGNQQLLPGKGQHKEHVKLPITHPDHAEQYPLSAANGALDPGRKSSNMQPDQSHQSLLDRIQNLEKKLATTDGGSMRQPKPKQVVEGFEQKKLDGTVSKTRFFGSSHWMHSFGVFDEIVGFEMCTSTMTPGVEITNDTHLMRTLISQCKSLARKAKSAPHKQWLSSPNFRETVPPKEICDQLVEVYFRIYESTSRVLHRPSFFKEYADYWLNPAETNAIIVLKILMVMAIGACGYQGSDAAHWRLQALQWIFSAQSFLSSPFEKSRLNIPGLQVTCLLLVARIENAVSGDLVWITAGSLMRTAFQMGFHRDPRYLPNLKPLHAEIRRRLWATILEINIQSALDSGMPPLISLDDFDTEPPSNLNDDDITEDSVIIPPSKPDSVYTDTSLQRLLYRSMALRLEVIRNANNFHYEPSYDEVLTLSEALSTHCKENNAFVNRINTSSPIPKISQLNQNLLDIWNRRFLISLHRPFAVKGLRDPRYYFSRKCALDYAMTMLNYPSNSPSHPAPPDYKQDDYSHFITVSGNFYKSIVVHSTLIIFAELIAQLKEADTTSQVARDPLKATLQKVRVLSGNRIKTMDNNIKGHLFVSIVIAQIDALERGEHPQGPALKAGTESAKMSLELLEARIKDQEHSLGSGNTYPTPETSTEATFDFGEEFMMQDWVNSFNVPDGFGLGSWQDF